MDFKFNEHGLLNLVESMGIKKTIGEIKKGRINFNTWTEEEREEYYYSWDDENYFRSIYENDKNRIYNFMIYNTNDMGVVGEIIDEPDETTGTILTLDQIKLI